MVKMVKVSEKTHQVLKDAADASGFSIREVADLLIGQGDEMKKQVNEATKQITTFVKSVQDTQGLTDNPNPVTYEETDLETDEVEHANISWGWVILIGLGFLYLRAKQTGGQAAPWDALRGLGVI